MRRQQEKAMQSTACINTFIHSIIVSETIFDRASEDLNLSIICMHLALCNKIFATHLVSYNQIPCGEEISNLRDSSGLVYLKMNITGVQRKGHWVPQQIYKPIPACTGCQCLVIACAVWVAGWMHICCYAVVQAFPLNAADIPYSNTFYDLLHPYRHDRHSVFCFQHWFIMFIPPIHSLSRQS